MTWFKVDDQFAMSPKALAAGNAACGLWVRAGSWAAAQLTDGDVPATVLPSLGGRAADARKLVDARLWHGHGHDCEKCPDPKRGHYVFHAWPEYQPMRADVEAKRAKRAEAGRQGGIASGRTRRGEATAKQSASAVLEPPARPGPTRTAAAAAEGSGGGVLRPELQVLRAKFQEFTVLADVSWSHLTDEDATEIVELIAVHGDRRLVDVARRTMRSAAMVQAFLPTWRDLAGPRLVVTDPEANVPCAECRVPKSQHRGPSYDHPFTTERNTA